MAQVLVVEDENIVALDIKKSLIDMGYDVLGTVTTGEECIRVASERCPDLVLMDIRIKGNIDGVSTAEILKDKFDVPVVFLTAHADDETIDRAKKSSPFGYLLKPFKPAELKSVVEIAISKHEVERKIRMREKWLSTSMQAIGDAVIAVDKAGNITFMNSTAEEITGHEQANVVGRKLVDVMPLINENTRELVQTPIIRVLKEKKVFSLPANTSLVGQQNEMPIETSAAIIDDAGELAGAVIVFRSEKEKKEHMKQQVALADRLTSLGTLVSGVAHEINNPLSVVVANAAFVTEQLEKIRIKDNAIFDEIMDAMKDIEDASERVRKIVLDLKIFSKPQQEVVKPVDLHEVLEWATRITTNQVRHSAQLVKRLAPVPKVDGSDLKLGQVFVNLIVNAAQAIEVCNSQNNQIEIKTFTDENGFAVIEIKDSGCGIGPDTLRRIFDPFFTTKPVGTGTGLGLSISRGIIHALNGQIEVESHVGKGSLFRVKLPPSQTKMTNATSSTIQFNHQFNRRKVLVIDDEPLILKLIQRALADHYDVTTKSSSLEAYSYLKAQNDFDIILCDLMMPEMTGMELFERVSETMPDLTEKFVFMTGGAFTPTAMEFLNTNMNKHLDKPFSSTDLESFVNGFVETPELSKQAS